MSMSRSRTLIVGIICIGAIIAFGVVNFRAAKAGEGDGDGLLPPMCGVVVPLVLVFLLWLSSRGSGGDKLPPL
jgi:hypothetical protein